MSEILTHSGSNSIDFPISASQTGGRLSTGTIGGIIGGVLGGALLISLAIIVYMCNQRRRTISNDVPTATSIYGPTEQHNADEKTIANDPLPQLRTEPGEEEIVRRRSFTVS